ncbi:hypothetical protein [Streptococcus marmotae]|uniref:hypothetical protein n=1 Tax=Streptococcus marmotae TaxID=1825069 RepID=UPI000833ECA6|nr:hypothetical protein [Streptococcus marmotae]QBX16927.1 hypothetical protein Javan291_0051 [Streptococcus phage Javan291]
MVVIQKKSNVIPIDFGEFVLEYKANDAGIKYLEGYGKNLMAKSKELAELSDEEAQEAGFEFVKGSWSDLFDEATFNKVYAFAEEDSVIALHYLIQATQGIISEYKERNSQDVFKKYLSD